MLVVSQHFFACVAHEFQLIFAWGLNPFEHCRKGVAAAIWRQFSFDSAGVQYAGENFTKQALISNSFPAIRKEGVAGNFGVPFDYWPDFRGNRNAAVCSRFRFATANQKPFLPPQAHFCEG